MVVAGGGAAGLATRFPAQAGLTTIVADAGTSTMRETRRTRNTTVFPSYLSGEALIENGRGPRARLDARAREAKVARAARVDAGFRVERADAAALHVRHPRARGGLRRGACGIAGS